MFLFSIDYAVQRFARLNHCIHIRSELTETIKTEKNETIQKNNALSCFHRERNNLFWTRKSG